MTLRQRIDPELALLRSVARSLEGGPRQDLESARFNLYAAAEAEDVDLARRWLDSCHVALDMSALPAPVQARAARALGRIAAVLEAA